MGGGSHVTFWAISVPTAAALPAGTVPAPCPLSGLHRSPVDEAFQTGVLPSQESTGVFASSPVTQKIPQAKPSGSLCLARVTTRCSRECVHGKHLCHCCSHRVNAPPHASLAQPHPTAGPAQLSGRTLSFLASFQHL